MADKLDCVYREFAAESAVPDKIDDRFSEAEDYDFDWEDDNTYRVDVSDFEEFATTKYYEVLWSVTKHTSPGLVYDANIVGADEDSLHHLTISEIRAGERPPCVRNPSTEARLIAVEGVVKSASAINQTDAEITFKCENCGTAQTLIQNIVRDDIHAPDGCVCEDADWVRLGADDRTAHQTLVLEEPAEEAESTNPSDLVVDVHGGLVGRAEAGDRVRLNGYVYHEYDEQGSLESTPRFYSLGIENLDGSGQIDEGEIDEDAIREEVESEGFYDRLQNSIAPDIVGVDHLKRGVIATMMTGGTIEMRGSQKRGDSHVLLVGEPGTGKSKIIEFVAEIAPRGGIESMDNSSDKGLTATAVEDERLPQRWTLRAGHLVRCHCGVACIDELDKGENSNLDALHTPLSQGVVRRSVAGEKREMPSRCRVLSAANPVDSVYDDHEPLRDQFDFPSSLLDRFDLIYAVQRQSMDDIGEEMADSLIEGVMGEPEAVADGGLYDKEWLCQYIYLAWQVDPEYTRDALERVKEGWMSVLDGQKAEGRELDALLRLSRGFARLRLSDEVKEIDAERAVEVWLESLDSYASSEDGHDLSIKDDGLPARMSQMRSDIKQVVDEMQDVGDSRGCATDVVVEALSDEYDSESIRDRVERMLEIGDLMGSNEGLAVDS